MSKKEVAVICAWCKKDLGTKICVIDDNDEHPITHGICPDCARKTLSYKAISLQEFLNTFETPVFLVDDDARVMCANNAALSVVDKDIEHVEHQLGGDVFNCEHARYGNGCGQNIHCKSCTIRNTVMHTMRTGKSNIKVPAYPDLHHITKEHKIKFLITTEKVGNGVLLQIDEISEE